jgi:hypothetical protein
MIKQVIINSTSESILPCAKVKPNIQLRILSASLVPMKSHFFCIKIYSSNQLLVGSVVISAELGREDHCSIPRNCDREELKLFDARTDPKPN